MEEVFICDAIRNPISRYASALTSIRAVDLAALLIKALLHDEEEAIALGNDIVFGLAAGVWTSDIGRALQMSEKLKAGTI